MPQKNSSKFQSSFFTSHFLLKAILIIGVVGFVVHWSVLFNGFIGDDDQQILNNPAVHSLANISNLFLQSTFYTGQFNAGGLYYKPLMSTSFALLYAFFGPHAFAFHLFQLILFLANAVLILLILRYFFSPTISLFLTLIFVVHPINAENAAYISDLQELLFFFFGSIALLLDLHTVKSKRKFFLVGLLLLLSLFSKESGILFIAGILGYELIFRKKTLGNMFLTSTVVLIVYGFFRVLLAHLLFQTNTILDFQVPFVTRLYSVPSVVVYYLKNSIIPSDHAVLQMGLMTPKTLSIFLLHLLIIANTLGVLLLFGRLIYIKSRTYFQKYLFFVFILIAGLLFHSQLFFPLDFIAADRWFYFPFIGFSGIIGSLIQVRSKKLSFIPMFVWLFLLISTLCFLSVQSYRRDKLFLNNITILSHDEQLQPESGLLAGDLGYVLLQNGKNKEAEPYLLKAERLDPKSSMIMNELGTFYYLSGEEDNADKAFKKSLTLENSDYQTYQNYAVFLFLYREPKVAEKIIQEGIAQFPSNGVLWRLYALTAYKLGEKQIALHAAQQAYLFDPNVVTRTILARLSANMALDIIVYQSDKHRLFQVCPPDCVLHNDLINPEQVSDTLFSNTDMNMKFKFPYNLKITQVSPELVSLSTPGNRTSDSRLYVYSSTFSGDLNAIPIPFVQKGTIKSTAALPLTGFHAEQINYTDGTAVIVLVQKQRVFELRIPQDSSPYEQAITDIFNSIETLR